MGENELINIKKIYLLEYGKGRIVIPQMLLKTDGGLAKAWIRDIKEIKNK